MFLISLGSTRGFGSFGDKVGINQVVWDTASNTLHVESDELLEQHTRYALVVTSRVRDASGNPVGTRSRRHADDDDDDDKIGKSAQRHGVRIVGASIFTTQSTTSTLQKVHTPGQRSDARAGELHARLRRRAHRVPARQPGRRVVQRASSPPAPALDPDPGAAGRASA